MTSSQGPLLNFADVPPGEDVNFPESCLSGYFFLWNSCVSAPSDLDVSEESEAMLREELVKLKNCAKIK